MCLVTDENMGLCLCMQIHCGWVLGMDECLVEVEPPNTLYWLVHQPRSSLGEYQLSWGMGCVFDITGKCGTWRAGEAQVGQVARDNSQFVLVYPIEGIKLGGKTRPQLKALQ